jgi:hypothetical protein
MAIVSLCRFVTVVAVQERPDRTESGEGREAIQPIPLPPIASSCVECFDCKKLDSFSFCLFLILRLFNDQPKTEAKTGAVEIFSIETRNS